MGYKFIWPRIFLFYNHFYGFFRVISNFSGVSNTGPLSSSTDTLRILLLDSAGTAPSGDQPRPPTSPIPRVQQLPSPPAAPPPPPLMQMIHRPVLFQNNLGSNFYILLAPALIIKIHLLLVYSIESITNIENNVLKFWAQSNF